MTRKQARRHNRIGMRILMTLAVVLMVHMVVTTVRGEQRKQEAEERQRQEIIDRIQNAESLDDICAGVAVIFNDIAKDAVAAGSTEEIPDVFSSMSMDYGGEEEGFVYYEIPEEYQKTGGYLPKEVQIYTYCLCKQEGVRYALILAMIEHESGYKYDSIGDDGESFGYMQIMQKFHEDRMKEIGSGDLLNPYQNIRLGVDIMKELIDKYGTIQDALAVYNYGATGAKEHLWSNGIYVYDYNESIMNRMKEIEEELGQ